MKGACLVKRRLLASGVAVGLVIALSACAPEPEDGDARSADTPLISVRDSAVPFGDEGRQLEGESTETLPKDEGILDGRQPVELEKSEELPSDFPLAAAPIPDSAIVDDAGTRGEGRWFVVLRTDSITAANDLLAEVVAGGELLEVTAETQEDGGVLADYESSTLIVNALTFMDSEGRALVNLEVTQK